MPLTTADTLEILDLIARYNHAIDSDDGEAYADTYTDDGVFQYPRGSARGRRELAELAHEITTNMPGVRHWSSNWIIEGEGDAASMTCYALIKVTDEGKPRLVGSGIYTDTLRRVDGAWKFQRRDIAIDGWSWPHWP